MSSKDIHKMDQEIIENMMEQYGKGELSCLEIKDILPSFPLGISSRLKNRIYQEHKKFWKREDVVDYYLYKSSKLSGTKEHDRILLQLIKKLKLPDDLVIIDLGSGGKRLTQKMQRLHKDAIFTAIDYAIIHPEIKTRNEDIQRGISEDGESVDLIVSNWSLYLFEEEMKRAIQEIYRILKPGGYFIFASILRDKSLDVKIFFKGLQGFRRKVAFIFEVIYLGLKGILKQALKIRKEIEYLFPAYTEDELKGFLEKNGFNIQKIESSQAETARVFLAKKQ